MVQVFAPSGARRGLRRPASRLRLLVLSGLFAASVPESAIGEPLVGPGTVPEAALAAPAGRGPAEGAFCGGVIGLPRQVGRDALEAPSAQAAPSPLPKDASTLLLLRFDGSLTGVDGEGPVGSTGTSFTEGMVGGAVHTGKPGGLRYGVDGNISPGQGTVELWIRPDWDGNGNKTHLFFQVGYNFDNGLLLSIDGANNLRFLVWGDDVATPQVERNVETGVAGGTAAGWSAGTWYHLAATWNAGALEFYLNGRPALAQGPKKVIIPQFATTTFTIGSSTWDGDAAEAAFDEVRISSRARTAGEIMADYYAGLGYAGLVDPRGVAAAGGGLVAVAESGLDRVLVHDASGQRLREVGGGQLSRPWDVAFDVSGGLVVADTGHDRLVRTSPQGTVLGSLGAPGSGPGQLRGPRGVFVDAATGKVYAADTGNHRVQRFRADGSLDTSWGAGGVVGTSGVERRDHTGFSSPTDVAVNPVNGLVYVADFGNHRLEVFDPQGAYVRSYLAVYRPNGLAFDAAGNLYVAGEDPNDGYTAMDGRLRVLGAGDELVSRHYTGGLDDVGRVLAGVAVGADGGVVFSDPLNGRLVKADPSLAPPLSGLSVVARGTSLTLRWKTSKPGASVVRYGPGPSVASEAVAPGTTTDHSVTLRGLTPGSRLYYSVSFPDTFDASVRFTPPQVLETGAEAGLTPFLRVKAIGLVDLDTDPGPAFVPMSSAQRAEARGRFATVSLFYWINSGFRLWLDYTLVERDTNIVAACSIFRDVEPELRAAGFSAASGIDALHAASFAYCGNFGGASSLFGRSIARAEWTTATDFVAVHEANHSMDAMYALCGIPGYEFNHGIWAVPNGVGADLAVNGQILRNMLPASLTATKAPFSKVLLAPDTDGDGLPDASPGGLDTPLAVTEASLGTSPGSTDTDGDGLTDLEEAMALPLHATDPGAADSDGDGTVDGLDPNPAYPVTDVVRKGSPRIDGTVSDGEGWTVVTDRWGFSNDLATPDSDEHQGRTTTYAAWDDAFLYLALKGPGAETRVTVDADADNDFLGPANYELVVRNDQKSLRVRDNVGVPDLFRQIDDDGQFGAFFDTDPQFTKAYQGRTIYDHPDDGLGFPGRLVTEQDVVYARGGSGSEQVWEVAIPRSRATGLRPFEGGPLALSYSVGGDVLLETDHAARLTLAGAAAPCLLAASASVPATARTGAPVPFEAFVSAASCVGAPAVTWSFGDGGVSSSQRPVHAFSADGTYHWSLSATVDGRTRTRSGAITVARNAGGCVPDGTTLCVSDGPGDSRFRVSVDWQTGQGGGGGGKAHAVPTAPIGVGRGGLFWFFAADNPEMLVKVLNGCAVNGSYWVFTSAGTNVGMTTRVADTFGGGERLYVNADGAAAAAVQDVEAFACSADRAAAGSLPEGRGFSVAGAPRRAPEPPVRADVRPATTERVAAGPCVPGSTSLCIDDTPGDRRFSVTLRWATAQGGGQAGSGQALSTASLGIRRGGLFWFFGAENPEMLVKVLNGCSVNDRFWVFTSAGTNVGLETTVTDTLRATTRTYTSPDLTPAQPVQDVEAFPCR